MTHFLDGIQPQDAPDPEPVIPDFRAAIDTDTDAPPRLFSKGSQRKPRESRAQQPKKPAPPYQPGKVRDAMLESYRGLAFFVMPFKPEVGVALMAPVRPPSETEPEPPSVAENCADAWEAAAKQYAWVRNMVEGGIGFAVIIGLVVAHAPIFAAVVSGTPIAERLNPAAAMEAMLKRQSAEDNDA